uniref:Uncharacterized protein n=1 Tax=Panagrolaimus davidi TaxID=227884 RepID=A0A914QAB3_9BILA
METQKEMINEYETCEDVLTKLGWKNIKLCYIILSMAFIWSLIAMPVMASSFIVGGIKCPSSNNNTECAEINERFYSINKEFNISSDSLKGDWFLTIFFIGNMLVGTFLSYLADM